MGQKSRPADWPPRRRVLLLRLSALGDVVMLLPLLRDAVARNPEVEWVVVSQPFVASLFAQFPTVRFLPAAIRAEHKGIKGLWRLASEIRKAGPYDGIADLHSVLRTWLLRFFLFVQLFPCFPRCVAISKGRRDKRALCKRGAQRHRSLPHTITRYGHCLRRFGLSSRPRWQVGGAQSTPEEIAEAKKLLDGQKAWIGIAPFAKHQGKCYTLENTFLVAKILSLQGYGICFFGAGAKEEQILATWSEQLPSSINMASLRLGLRREVVIMGQLTALFAMDSANMHLGAWAGTRVVSFWGATHPKAGFMGWGVEKSDTIQRVELECRPCSVYGKTPCHRGDYACLDIPPQRIAERLMVAAEGNASKL